MNKKKAMSMERKQKKNNINVASEVASLLNDKKVQEDRVVQLGMLSILAFYLKGVQIEDLNRIEIINSICFANVLDNYRPGMTQQLKTDEFHLMADKFCDGLKSIVKAELLCCFKEKNNNCATIDYNLVADLWDSIMEKTRV